MPIGYGSFKNQDEIKQKNSCVPYLLHDVSLIIYIYRLSNTVFHLCGYSSQHKIVLRRQFQYSSYCHSGSMVMEVGGCSAMVGSQLVDNLEITIYT